MNPISFSKAESTSVRVVRRFRHLSSSARKNLSISGEDEPRQIISGLRQYYKLDDLENRSCLVVCNLPVRFVILFSDIITFYTTTNRKQRFAVSNRLEWYYAE